MQTIGILLPRSTYYGTIAFDMHAGLREGLKHNHQEDLRIVVENIGFGAEKQSVYRAAEKMLLEENVDVVFAYIGHRTAQLLRPLFASANRLLIVLDAGASLPHEWPVSSHVFFHSLHNSLGAWLASERAIKDGYKNGGMVSNYFDGGYLHTMAITSGFTEAGGIISFNHATGYRSEDFILDPLKEHLSNYPDAALLGLFSGDFAEWLFRDLTRIFPEQQPAVYAAPFLLEENMLSKCSSAGRRIKGIAAWSKHLTNPENTAFINAMNKAGREANLFSLLGWEAAKIAGELTRLIKEHENNGRIVGDELSKFSFDSPRGKIVFDPETHYSKAPLYNAQIIDNGNGYCDLEITGTAEGIEEAWKKLIALQLNEHTSGWYNSYVCN